MTKPPVPVPEPQGAESDPTEGPAPTILIVDDDERFRSQLARALSRRGYEVREAEDYDTALAEAKRDSPEYAVVDLRMPGKSGLELLRDLVANDETTRVVMLTGYGSISTAVEAMRLGAVNYVPKPADARDILAAFERAERAPLEGLSEDFEAPSLERAEWEHIQRVLAECEQNISRAARRLRIHRRTLQRKLSRYPPSR